MAEASQFNPGTGNGTMNKFNSTELVVRQDILAKTKELSDLLTTSDEVVMYQKAEKQIANNEKIQTLISAIKKKQKEVVAFESFQNADMVSKIESEMKQLQDELDDIPLVRQFQQTQTDINYLLQLVVSVIKDSISDKINVESGDDVSQSEYSD